MRSAAGEVAGGAVIAGDDDRGPGRLALQERRDEVRAQRLRDERAAAVALERGGLRIVIGMREEGAEHPHSQSRTRREAPAVARQTGLAEDDPLGRVGGVLDERGDVLAGLGEAAEHVRRDAVGIGRRRAAHADPDAAEVGRTRDRS